MAIQQGSLLSRYVMWTKVKRHILQRRDALLIFGLCGLVGVLPDLDHVLAYEKGWDYLLVRPLHTPILVVASVVLCACCTCCGGLLIRMVLKKL